MIFIVSGYKELWILEFGSLSSKIKNSVKSTELEIVLILHEQSILMPQSCVCVNGEASCLTNKTIINHV